ncbi:Sh3yl1-prov protein [Capsaspora owczarzaki ATCC 30864]|uniref:Sh3yl1-prov protein n=1 Tax=Capsaspora owczarzaki (strain ATCC 30864) TaxID=595528 RepID=A0A0D2X3A8_CAPO3|nr:Sh3yl1-prov protein [Capsaspora owczarzaki ATCC 30864]KJE93984.1 Sh3yl1-prov protein [Capsaspora owczarzaki ATCC 30864]|eukprot:XP_004347442.1 Sh3yl1-prov protein [Capsaspora owczarzaki ATCC 30864]
MPADYDEEEGPMEVPEYLHSKARAQVSSLTVGNPVPGAPASALASNRNTDVGPTAKDNRGGNFVSRKVQRHIDECSDTLSRFIADAVENKGNVVTLSALQDCLGIVVLMVTRVAVGISGRGGRGFVIAKLRNGKWSAPSAVSMGGIGLGVELGGERTGMVLLLHTQEAVAAFSRGSVNCLGGNFTAVAGHHGKNLESDHAFGRRSSTAQGTELFTYSHSKGLFIGASFEWALFRQYIKGNKALYPSLHPDERQSWEILAGHVASPPAANKLYQALTQGSALVSLETWKRRRASMTPPRNASTTLAPLFLGEGTPQRYAVQSDANVRYGGTAPTSSLVAWPGSRQIQNTAGVVRISPHKTEYRDDY